MKIKYEHVKVERNNPYKKEQMKNKQTNETEMLTKS